MLVIKTRTISSCTLYVRRKSKNLFRSFTVFGDII